MFWFFLGRLVFLDYLPHLIQLISTERSAIHEHILSLLVALAEENPSAIAECKNPKYNLKEVLQRYIGGIRNREECLVSETADRFYCYHW